jgi:hypothetical protein
MGLPSGRFLNSKGNECRVERVKHGRVALYRKRFRRTLVFLDAVTKTQTFSL